MWIVYGLLAALTAALMTIVAKIGLQKVDPTFATGIRSFFMFAFMAGVVGVSGKYKGWQNLSKKEWMVIAIAAVFGALSWLFYFLGLKETTASKLASLDRLSLPLVIFFSILFLSESPTWQLVVGGLLVTGGAILVAWK
jgi:bacterial/archaeal transporter family protein